MLKLHFIRLKVWQKLQTERYCFLQSIALLSTNEAYLFLKIEIKIYTNPLNQKSIGRHCDVLDVRTHTYGMPDIVKQTNFLKPLRKVLPEPRILIAFHGDGTNQTKDLELLNFAIRPLNLGRVSRNPPTLLAIPRHRCICPERAQTNFRQFFHVDKRFHKRGFNKI